MGLLSFKDEQPKVKLPIATEPAKSDPSTYDAMTKTNIKLLNARDYSIKNDHFADWGHLSVSQGGLAFIHMYQNDSNNQQLLPMAKMFRRFLIWLGNQKITQVDYIISQRDCIAEIRWVCDKVLV
jgi:hypothetical protein